MFRISFGLKPRSSSDVITQILLTACRCNLKPAQTTILMISAAMMDDKLFVKYIAFEVINLSFGLNQIKFFGYERRKDVVEVV